MKEEVEKKFEYIKLKEKHFFETCRMLMECNWPYKIVFFEDTGNDYYSMVTITFSDEAKYFRHLHIPYPRLQDIAENGEEYAEIAENILKRIGNREVIIVPRTIWGKIHIRDICKADLQ